VSVVANVAINIDGKQAAAILDDLKRKVEAMNGTFDKVPNAAKKIDGLGSAALGLVGKFVSVAAAVATVQKGLTTAFERGAAEQRLKNLASSTGEYEAALGVAAATADKFGMSQTEATQALADIYSRLKGVGFGLKETSQIYDGFNAIAKQSGVAGADAAGVFFQLSQALGKGKLNGDEFVSVSERMPQLLDAIAQATGRSRGELSQMAQDGEITSEVLFKALSGSAAAAGDLNGKLTEQQKAFNALSQVSDRLLNSIGQVFAPVVIKGAELFAKLGQQTAEWWDYLGAKVFPKFLAAIKPATDAFQKLWSQIPWDTIVGYIQGAILIGLNGIIEAVKLLSPLVGFVVTKFAELAQNPVFQFIAEQVGRLAQLLGLSNTEVNKFTEEQKKSEQAAAGTVSQYSSMPEKIQKATEAAKQLKEQQQAVTDAIKESGAAIDASAAASQAIADQRSSITQAYLQAEMQINDVLLDQLNRQLDGAKTQAERVAVARDIYKLTVQQANLEYEAARAQIAAEVEKAHLALMATEQKAKEVQLIVELATAQGHVNESHYKSLQLAHESVNLASVQAGTTRLIATQQERAAKAVLQGKINAAGAAFQTNILAKNTNEAANQSERFASGFQKAAAAVSGMSQNALTKKIYGSTTTTTTRANATPAVASSSANYLQSPSAMDSGSGSEYAIPTSKMQNAMQRYADGGRGSSTMPFTVSPQVNITTGPVMNMNGQNYVSQRDLMSGLMSASRSTAESVIDMLRSDMSVRREIGLS
jgi:tape measure domain-containing protein